MSVQAKVPSDRTTHRRGARRPRRTGRPRPSACSTAGRPCRSSRATARRSRAASTTPSCARSRSGSATCASSRSGAPPSSRPSRSRASSTTRCARRSSPPRPRRGSRTSTCRSSRSAAPRRRSPARPASSRSPTCCSAPLTPTRLCRGDVRRRRPGGRRRRRRSRRRPRDPRRALRRGRRPHRRPARAGLEAGPARLARPLRQGGGGREVLRLLRLLRAPLEAARRTASSPSSAARRRTCSPSTSTPTTPPSRQQPGPTAYERAIAHRFGIENNGRPADQWLADTVRWAWRTKILVHLGIDVRMQLRRAAEEEAVRVFAANLRDLLLAAPAGRPRDDGPRPGLPHRRQGRRRRRRPARVVATDVIYPHVPQNQWDRSLATLARLAQEHAVDLIAIGNGTASRETDRLAADLIKRHPELKLTIGRGLRGGRLGLLRLGLRVAGAARHGRLAARRRLHRAAPAGPARRARQDRPEVDRRRAVPARHLARSRCRARSTPSSRTASTPSGSTSTPRPRPC